MASITHSIGSLASSFENLLAGVAESILAVLRHAFNIVAGILRTSLNVSEEVLEDAWKVIEGIVGAVFCEYARTTASARHLSAKISFAY